MKQEAPSFFMCVFVSCHHGYIWNIFQVDVLSHASHDFGEMLLILLLSLPSYWEKILFPL